VSFNVDSRKLGLLHTYIAYKTFDLL